MATERTRREIYDVFKAVEDGLTQAHRRAKSSAHQLAAQRYLNFTAKRRSYLLSDAGLSDLEGSLDLLKSGSKRIRALVDRESWHSVLTTVHKLLSSLPGDPGSVPPEPPPPLTRDDD